MFKTKIKEEKNDFVEADGSGVQGQPGLHNHFEARLSYMRPYLIIIIMLLTLSL